MKKIIKKISLLAVLLFAVVGFSGCGSTNDNYSSSSSEDSTVNNENTPKAKVEVVTHSVKSTTYGSKHIVGEVINNGEKEASFVKVTATLYDKNETVVDTNYTYAGDTSSTALQSQMKVPFKIIIDSDFDHYKLDITWN